MNKVVHINSTFYGKTATIILDDGYAYVMVTILKDTPSVAAIHDLVVHIDKRGQGLGGILLEEACKAGEGMGADTIMLSVIPGSWLEEWYKRHGFRDIGEKETVFGVMHRVMEKKCNEENN